MEILETNRLPQEPGLETYNPFGTTTGALHHCMKQFVSFAPDPFPVKVLQSFPLILADILVLAVVAPTDPQSFGAAKYPPSLAEISQQNGFSNEYL